MALHSEGLKSEVKVTQSCLTLFNTMDYGVHGILHFRILKWVAFLFSRGFTQPRDPTQASLIAGGLLSLIWEPDLYTNTHITGHHGVTNTTLWKSDLGTNTASYGAKKILQIKVALVELWLCTVSGYEGEQNWTKMYME